MSVCHRYFWMQLAAKRGYTLRNGDDGRGGGLIVLLGISFDLVYYSEKYSYANSRFIRWRRGFAQKGTVCFSPITSSFSSLFLRKWKVVYMSVLAHTPSATSWATLGYQLLYTAGMLRNWQRKVTPSLIWGKAKKKERQDCLGRSGITALRSHYFSSRDIFWLNIGWLRFVGDIWGHILLWYVSRADEINEIIHTFFLLFSLAHIPPCFHLPCFTRWLGTRWQCDFCDKGRLNSWSCSSSPSRILGNNARGYHAGIYGIHRDGCLWVGLMYQLLVLRNSKNKVWASMQSSNCFMIVTSESLAMKLVEDDRP